MAEKDQNNMPLNAQTLSGTEIDAIGEILNISMGAAATAVSTMLDRQVIITTPKVQVQRVNDVSYETYEPAMLVKIEYIEGISGSNVMVFRQDDMRLMINLLMGNEDASAADFEFDELSISAACEVMNQMMGSSATALSSFLGKNINISTPTASLLATNTVFKESMGVEDEENIVTISFNLNIEGIMNSDFISIMSCPLAKAIVSQVMHEGDFAIAEEPAPAPAPAPQAAPTAPAPAPSAPAHAPAPAPQAAPAVPAAQAPAQATPQQPVYGQPPYYPPQYMPENGAYPYMPYPPNMPGYPPYGYPMPQQPMQPPLGAQAVPGQPPASGVLKSPVNVQTPQFPSFQAGSPGSPFSVPLQNMDLVMNVPLSVSVEIGKTKKKIKDIMEFNQGTVIELEKQAGAPVDIVVNGQLIARGDVIVIDDNFGVRITEIVGTKELVNAIENN